MSTFVRHYRFCPGLVLVLILTGPPVSVLSAAPTTRPAPAQFLAMRADRVDDETAALMEERPAAGQPENPTLELQIDLRVTASGLLHQAADSGSEDFQSCGYLRAQSLLDTADLLAQRLQKSPPTAAQIDTIRRLHEATFRLGDLKSVARMDEACKALANLLVTIGSPLSAGQGLPIMRPRHVEQSQVQQVEPPSPDELMVAARHASISPALRRQLTALAQATIAASADPQRKDEAATLYGVLIRSVEMTRGIQQGDLVDAQTREQIEPQLTDGIVLFLDPRTRLAGLSRIDRLAAFGEALRRVRALPIPADLRDRLSPALIWVQHHPEQGPVVVQTIDEFLGLCRRFDARKPQPALPEAQRKVVSELERQFSARRQGFIADAANLSGSGSTASIVPQQLRAHVSAMGETLEQIDLVNAMPAALEAVLAFKPRPTGGLERRALVATNALGGFVQLPTRADAVHFLKQLQTLGQVAKQITANDLPAEVNRLYAGSKFSEFNSRRAEMITEIASQAAAGKPLDATRLARLAASQELTLAAREAAGIEATLGQADTLTRWADWHVQPQTLRLVLTPYREATSAAISSFADGDAAAIDLWRPVRQRNEPLVALLRELGVYGQQCRSLPVGWPGELARLLTPLDHQPFAAERHASLLLAAWETANTEGNTTEAARLSEVLDAQLRNDMGIVPPTHSRGDR